MAPLVPNLRTFVITVSPYDELWADRFFFRHDFHDYLDRLYDLVDTPYWHVEEVTVVVLNKE